MDPPTLGGKRHKIGASPWMHYTPSRILFTDVKGCNGACIVCVFLFFFRLYVVRSGASCALHRRVFRNVVSAWESCVWCREDWGDSCPLRSPLCIGTVEGEMPHRGCAAAHLLLGAGLEVNMLKLVSRADLRHSDVVFMLRTLEICSSK